MSEANLAWDRDMWAALNAHDLDGWTKMLAEDHVWEMDALGGSLVGREAAREAMWGYLRGFPDLRWQVEEQVVNGDSVITRWWAKGTHQGPFLGITPTWRAISVHGVTVTWWRDGKVARLWGYWDSGWLMRQLQAWPESWAPVHWRARAS